MYSEPLISNSHCSFLFTNPATTDIYTLSLHDALPISLHELRRALDLRCGDQIRGTARIVGTPSPPVLHLESDLDRKSTRLNSSHLGISYAVFCLKKKSVLREVMKIVLLELRD